ncbi:MAG TPA: hypothetical protein VHZ30_03380, partial [Verrucomicrobiae bacterium]|nr:hypothetical protein [Verrucomicrobiae bacterium]
GVQGLELEYYDGLDWYDTWGDITGKKQANSDIEHPNLDGMPQAIRITLSFDSEPASKKEHEEEAEIPTSDTPRTNSPALVFQTVVYLELAAISTSSGSSSGDSGGAANSPNGTPRQNRN